MASGRGWVHRWELFDCEPGLARVCFVDVLAAGQGAVEHRERRVLGLTMVIATKLGVPESEMPPFTLRSVVGWRRELIHAQVVHGRGSLLDQLGPLMGVIGVSASVSRGGGTRDRARRAACSDDRSGRLQPEPAGAGRGAGCGARPVHPNDPRDACPPERPTRTGMPADSSPGSRTAASARSPRRSASATNRRSHGCCPSWPRRNSRSSARKARASATRGDSPHAAKRWHERYNSTETRLLLVFFQNSDTFSRGNKTLDH